MAKTVNKTSKKEDIWDAYNELVAKLEEKANEEPKKKQENMQQNEIIKSTTDMNAEKIIKNIAALKSNLSASLDSLEETMLQEFKKLEFIKKSIEIEEAKIKNTFDIQTNAHSLIALVTLQKEQKESFEIEMNELRMNFESEMNSKREQWKHENEDTEKANKDKKSENDKQRKREEEEYQYNLTLNRKKENDAFIEKQELLEKGLAEKKATFEKEFVEREVAIKNTENELKELRKKVAGFPDEINAAVTSSEERLTEKLTSAFEFEKQLAAKQIEGDNKLKDQTIQTLKEKIKDIEASVKELTQKAIVAEAGVKDIALKAIESSRNLKFVEAPIKSGEKN